jgi:hypothetical protein
MLSTRISRSRHRHRSERINLFAGSMRGAADDQETTAPPHNAAQRLTRQRRRGAAFRRPGRSNSFIHIIAKLNNSQARKVAARGITKWWRLVGKGSTQCRPA